MRKLKPSLGRFVLMQTSVRTNIKTVVAARRLGISVREMVSYLFYLWAYTVENNPSGELPIKQPRDLAYMADFDIDRAEEFLSVMTEIGFLDELPDGYKVHDWEEHTGRAFYQIKKKRETERVRIAAKRAAAKEAEEIKTDLDAVQPILEPARSYLERDEIYSHDPRSPFTLL